MKPTSVGLHLPNRPALLFATAPLYMREGNAGDDDHAGSRPRSPGLIPARICTAKAAQSIDSTACTASTVMLDRCSDQPSSYLG
jgi:hypothetical protein